MALESAQLDNGLALYVDHVPGATTNNVTMFVPYGSVNEAAGDEGVAHAFEHCVHLKTDMFDDRSALRQHAKLNGMVTNANTYYTRTAYLANGLSLEPNVIHLSQILQHTHLPEDGVAHEMKAVRREATTGLDNISGLHSVAADYAMFGQPYGRRVIGPHDALDFSSDKLQKLHRQYYSLGSMTLVVTGAVKFDEVARLANHYFVADDEINEPVKQETIFSLGEDRLTGYIREDSSSVRLKVSYPMTAEFREQYNKNRIALGVASMVMREACFQALRYEKGISYDGGISIADYNHPNAWHINGYVTTDSENIDTALGVFADTFQKKGTDYTDDDLTGALAMYKYYFSKYLTSPDERMESHLARLESYRQPEDLRIIMRRLKKLRVEDVRKAVDEIADFTASALKYTHLTGKQSAIGEVERIIRQDEIA